MTTGNRMRFCFSGGLLLGAMCPLSSADDPAVADGEARACGALRCRACRMPVRVWNDFIWKRETPWGRILGDPEDFALDREIQAEVAPADDASDAGEYLRPVPLGRAYSCRCSKISLVGGCIDLGDVECTSPWQCAGRKA